MSQVIIYKHDEGVAIVRPSSEALLSYSIDEIAQKDVPAGIPYKIIDSADIPTDRTFRNAWEVDETTLTDGTGGEHNMFLDDPSHPDYVEPEVAE